MPAAYDELRGLLKERATLSSVVALLGWDQETMMPRKAAPFRAQEISMLGTLAHRKATDPRVGELLAACEADPQLAADPEATANLREIRWDYERALRLPPELVAEIGETGSLAMEAWKEARERSDFSEFLPWLEKQIRLNLRKAECYGTPEGGEPYDALLEDYEPGMTSAELERIFEPLREALVPLIEDLTGSENPPSEAPAKVRLPLDLQQGFNRIVLERLGFDMNAGRLDISTHPFSTGLAPGDTRITTRYREDGFLEALGSTMHEAGHGLYEQGLPKSKLHGQPLGDAASLGIHESQSRLWENQVGRSLAFWKWALPEAKRTFGAPLEPFSAEELYGAVNTVRPNLIRVESDEATYNLHVMLRFDLERAMIRGELAASDLPGAWNERIKKDLGLDVPGDREGCLQDIHWSMGSFGYFPTYSLGNLYAAQLWEATTAALPDLQEQIGRGEFGALLDWLRESVHAHGRRFPASELCLRVTGQPLGHEALMRHLDGKLRPIYSVGSPSSLQAD